MVNQQQQAAKAQKEQEEEDYENSYDDGFWDAMEQEEQAGEQNQLELLTVINDLVLAMEKEEDATAQTVIQTVIDDLIHNMELEQRDEQYTVDSELPDFTSTVPKLDVLGRRRTLPSYRSDHPNAQQEARRAKALGLDSRSITSADTTLRHAKLASDLKEFTERGWKQWFQLKLSLQPTTQQPTTSEYLQQESVPETKDTTFEDILDTSILNVHLQSFLLAISTTSTNYGHIAETNKAVQRATALVHVHQLKTLYGIDVIQQLEDKLELSGEEYFEAVDGSIRAQLNLAETKNEVHNKYVGLLRRWPIPKFQKTLTAGGVDVGLSCQSAEEILNFHCQRKDISIHACYDENQQPSIIEDPHESPAVTGKAAPLQYWNVVVWKLNIHGEDGRWIQFGQETSSKIWKAKEVCCCCCSFSVDVPCLLPVY